MKNFRKMIPMAVFALAIAGAFSTNAMNRSAKKTTNFPAFIRGNLAGTICTLSNQCSDAPGPVCMVGSTQLWGKDEAGKCIVELHRIP
jgi:hypothetical protein